MQSFSYDHKIQTKVWKPDSSQAHWQRYVRSGNGTDHGMRHQPLCQLPTIRIAVHGIASIPNLKFVLLQANFRCRPCTAAAFVGFSFCVSVPRAAASLGCCFGRLFWVLLLFGLFVRVSSLLLGPGGVRFSNEADSGFALNSMRCLAGSSEALSC